MGCNCGKPKRNGHCGVSPAVLQINNPSECVLFHRVEVPASMGDSVTNPPKPGAYRNTLLYYKADGEAFLYSSDGIPSKITGVVSDYACLENKPQINGVTLEGDKSLADIGVTNAINNALEPYTPTSGFAEVAFTGDYEDLENTPTPPVTHFYRPIGAGVDIPTPLFHNPDLSDQVTYQQFEDAILSGPVQIIVESGMVMTYEVRTVDIADIVVGSRMTFYATRNTFREVFQWESSEDAPMYVGDDPYSIQSNWSVTDSSAPDYIRNKPVLSAVATSGSYNDLTNKPDIPSGLHVFHMGPASVGNTAPIYHDYEKTNQVTLAQFIDAIASGPVQIYRAYDTRSFLIYYVDPIDAFIPDPPQYIGTLYANFGLRNPYGLGVEYFSWYEGATAPTYDSYDPNQSDWNETSPTNSSYIKNKPTIPTVNNATLTITQNGTSAGTFTANASSDTTISLTDTTYSGFSGATSLAAGASGLVPAPAAGDQGKFLQGDGTWAVVQSGPTVVQTTGQSTTDVMSQKAITDIIGDIETILQTLNSGNGAQQ